MRGVLAAVLAGTVFGVVTAVMTIAGGVLLVLANIASLWLALGFWAGHRFRLPGWVSGLLVTVLAVLSFYGVRFADGSCPLLVAGIWLAAALVVGPVTGTLGAWYRSGRWWALAVLGLAFATEPFGWSALWAAGSGGANLRLPEWWLTTLLVGTGAVLVWVATGRRPA